MFDIIRRNNKVMMGLLFLLVIPSFVLFGMGNNPLSEGSQNVAKVNGQGITQSEWDMAHQIEVDQLRNANPGLDLSLLDTPAMKYRSLERLVQQRVLAAAARNEHLTVADARLAAVLAADPNIAALRDAEGRLDVEGYRRLLALQGLTPEGFEARLRSDLSLQQVLSGVADTELFDPVQVDAAMAPVLERRQVRVLRFQPDEYAARLEPDEAQLQAYYQAHLNDYQVPESVDIEYVVLDLDGVKKNVAVSEAELRTYHEQNAASLGEPEQRRAGHILIAAAADEPQEQRAAARERADQLLQQLRADPERFAELAREHSDDDISAASGGDLGFFRREQGIDPVISEATYGLAAEGDISEVVETEFGYHLIRLSELKPAQVPDFEELRPQLEDQLRTQLAQAEFSELAETFSNSVYEQSDSLEPVAQRLGLEIRQASQVQRDPLPDASGALASSKFLSALFGSDALTHKRNTEAVELEGSQLVSGRVLTHTPAHAQPFAEAESAVRQAYLADEGARAARAEGEQMLKAWTAQPDQATDLPEPVTLSRIQLENQPEAVLDAVMRVDAGSLPRFVGVDLGPQGYAIAQVEKVLEPAEQTSEEQSQLQAQYARLWTQVETGGYYDYLKARYKVKMLVDTP